MRLNVLHKKYISVFYLQKITKHGVNLTGVVYRMAARAQNLQKIVFLKLAKTLHFFKEVRNLFSGTLCAL